MLLLESTPSSQEDADRNKKIQLIFFKTGFPILMAMNADNTTLGEKKKHLYFLYSFPV